MRIVFMGTPDFSVGTLEAILAAGHQVAAVVTECDSAGHAVLSLRNKFRAGDTVEIVGPDLRPFSITVPEMRDEAGASLVEPRTPQMKFYMDLPKAVPPYSLVRRGVDLSAK